MVELSDQQGSYEGRLIAKTPSHVCIMDRFGLITALEVKSLKSFKIVAGSYSPVSSIGLQQSLKKELPPGYEVAASAHYVVMGRKGKAGDYAKLFEEVYRQVDTFFSVRGFDTHLPEMPMVAFVFGTQAEFKAYCEAQNDQAMTKMRGYYSPKTNRVAMSEDPNQIIRVTAWSITYFLTENPARAGKFAKYLKKVSDRNPLHVYSATERLSAFQEIFGDISLIEVDLLRTMERTER